MGWLLAILSGILAGISYPTVLGGWRLPDLGFLAFFAWVPLFAAIGMKRPRSTLGLSFLASLVHYSISMYWLYTAMNSFGNMSPALSVLVLFLLVAFLSLEFSLIFWVSQRICLRLNLSHLWVRPVCWIAVEWMRGHLPAGGFPWSQVGYSQGGFLPFIQFADIFGIYGVTFAVVFINEVLWRLYQAWRQKRWSPIKIPAMAAALLMLGSLGYGAFRLRESPPAPLKEIQVGIVQGNIPQDEKWQRGAARRIIQTFLDGTLTLEERGAELVLWPEASWPIELKYDAPRLSFSLPLTKVDLLFGAVTRPVAFPGPRSEEPYYNSAILADAAGNQLDYYHKVHLVPFGEYVPLEKVFFFAEKFTSQIGRLRPGTGFFPMKYREHLLGVLICYEDIFPEISRIMTAKGAQALINITNDAWYGNSSAAYQHQVFSQFRAIETRRALIRATNTGISSAIDRWGRILWQGGLFTREDFLTKLPFYQDRTVYVRIGDLFCYIALSVSGVLLALSLIRRL